MNISAGDVLAFTNDELTITNNGNIAYNSRITLTLGYSTDEADLYPVGPTETIRENLHVGPGKTVKSHLTGWASIEHGLASGVYHQAASMTDSNGNSTKVVCLFLSLRVG